jgi:hypothetical protein
MPSVDEIAGQITGANVPVLFVDTCILLDVIRSTSRCLPNYARQALELLKLISSTPPSCLLVISSIVPAEWNENAPEVTAEIIRHLAEMDEQSSHFHDACESLDLSAGFGRAGYSGLGLAEKLRDLSHRILGHAICLTADDESRSRAVARVIGRIPPSKKNGQVKDCAIIEEYLAVCRHLNLSGFGRRRIFCTSNTNDYCEAGKGLHSKLASDFVACDLSFTTNLPWAIHELTH